MGTGGDEKDEDEEEADGSGAIGWDDWLCSSPCVGAAAAVCASSSLSTIRSEGREDEEDEEEGVVVVVEEEAGSGWDAARSCNREAWEAFFRRRISATRSSTGEGAGTKAALEANGRTCVCASLAWCFTSRSTRSDFLPLGESCRDSQRSRSVAMGRRSKSSWEGNTRTVVGSPSRSARALRR